MLYRQAVIDYGLGCQHIKQFFSAWCNCLILQNHFAPLQVDLNY